MQANLLAITAVAAGIAHSVALNTMGKVYTWGVVRQRPAGD
jgi:alpha-tubulin suppressor-like RCC1 family protein